jgi:hypothetical protein
MVSLFWQHFWQSLSPQNQRFEPPNKNKIKNNLPASWRYGKDGDAQTSATRTPHQKMKIALEYTLRAALFILASAPVWFAVYAVYSIAQLPR